MFAKYLFEKDNFTSRRTTGNNMFDPESLLTEGESRQGYEYDNSKRDWPESGNFNDPVTRVLRNRVYEAVADGLIPANLVPSIAPRVLISRGY